MTDIKKSILKCKYIFYGMYELPENIHSLKDLDENPEIINWGIKWGTLRIEYKNGDEIKIEPSIPIDETNSYKYPSDKPSEYIFETLDNDVNNE
jgi:hypothetical protein